MRTLLVGLGNAILGDDAVGIRLARDLGVRLAEREGLDVIPECSCGALDLLEQLEGYDRVFIVDSIATSGARAGDWHEFDERALETTRHLTGIHDCNLATALALGRELGLRLPPPERVHLFAVEISEGRDFGERLTAPLRRVYPELLEGISGALEARLEARDSLLSS